MKKFLGMICTATVLTLLMTVLLFAITTSASELSISDNVIFISDSAVPGGDGSSASSPLYPSAVPDNRLDKQDVTQNDTGLTVTIENNYMKTALYQAIEKLSVTGGTVVICGDVVIDSDDCRHSNYSTVMEYHTPFTQNPIKITSVYDGVDYRANGGLHLKGYAHIMLNCSTIWENMNVIYGSTKGDRVICCRGNKTVFGEGLNCTLDPSLSNSSAYYYSIAGGERYKNMVGDTDVTIKSGTFYKVLGTSWGGSNLHTGDTHIRIEGGKILTMISGNGNNGSNTGSIHNGNSYITITGGDIAAGVYAMGVGGYSDNTKSATIKITGCTFASTRSIPVTTGFAGYTGITPANFTVDLSDSKGVTNSTLNKILVNLPDGVNVKYPAHWATALTTVKHTPKSYVFSGETPDMSGAVLDVIFKNPVTNKTYSQTVEYTADNTAFKAECDTSTEGMKTVKYKYGNTVYAEGTIKVVKVPKVELLGVQIRTNTTAQQIRYNAKYTNTVSDGVTIEDCGIISIATDMLGNIESFNHKNTYGMYETTPGDKDYFYTDRGITHYTSIALDMSAAIRENNYGRDYTARAYVKFTYNGEEYYSYSEPMERNVYAVAKKAAASDAETSEVKKWLKTNVLDTYDTYDETKVYNAGMAGAARQKVVSYMESMRDVKWTPEETFLIYIEGVDGATNMRGIFYKGVEYTGIPYMNYHKAQTETFTEMINGTYIPIDNQNISIKSNSDWSKLTAEQKAVGLQNAKSFPGNDCVAAVILAWNTVLTNRDQIKEMNYTSSLIPGKDVGIITVGDYDYSNNYNNNTDQIARANGEQTMAEAYALLLPGDATNYVRSSQSGNPRHSRLVVKKPVVVRNSDGTINLEKSYVTCMDQAAGGQSRFIVGTNLTSIHTKDYYFSQLYSEGSLPITIPELVTGNTEAEFTYVTDLDLEADLPAKELSGIVKSNRQIISVRATVSKNGTVVGEKKDIISMDGAVYHTAEYNLSNLDLSEISLTAGAEYTFDLYACVSSLNGREVHLVSDYKFTAK